MCYTRLTLYYSTLSMHYTMLLMCFTRLAWLLTLQVNLVRFQCARNGYLDKAQTLLKNEKVKADINNDDEEGLTPLHYAARYNHFDMLQLLIENGAGKHSSDKFISECDKKFENLFD